MRIHSPYWSRWLLVASLLLTLLASNRLHASAAGRVKTLQAEATPTPRPQSTSGQAGIKPPTAEDIGDELGAQATGAVSSLREVHTAVIQIEAKGTFRSPEEGMQYNVSGAGSGFIIDPAGIAVTNNHVVTGAALLKVYVEGEDKPRNARVLGVSECSDLAVIDIEGDGFPYLDWYEEPLEAGLDVYAAGFPLGDPEYTLTDGIIAKAEADGETDWASVDHVVEHTAPIKPGNSGGPLVTEDGQVVGVNYAGSDEADQFYAIAGDIALPVIEQLRNGENVDTIGLNGQVMEVGDEGLQGIWVASVASGSPADTSGIKAGDVLLMMEGILVAEDGTLSQYCDILRSHSPDEVMSIEVIRYDSDEWLEGQLNGRALTLKTEIGEGGSEETSPASEASNQGADETYASFTIIENGAGTLSMEVPEGWSDTQDTEWILDDEAVGIRLVAAPNVENFMNSWDTPGIILSVSESLVEDYDVEGVLDFSDYADQCDKDDRYELESDYYTGYYDVWNNCGEAGSTNYIVALLPPEGNYIAKIEATAVTDADVDALNHVIASFAFNGSQATATTSNEDLGSDIFDIVDTSGMAYDYVFIRQPALSVLVPEQWTEIEPGDWESDGEVIGSKLDVAADIAAYGGWTTEPGMTVYTATGLKEDLDLEALLDETDYSEFCTLDKREKHSHTIYGHTYSGAYDIWTDCNDENNILIHLIAASEPADQVVFIDFLLVNEDDVDALDVLLQSFLVENGEETTGTPTEGSSGTTETDPSQYQTIVDDSGLLSVSVPNDWSDTRSGNWVKDEEEVGVYVAAAPNLDDFFGAWSTAGMFYGASTVLAETMNAEEYLDESSFSNDCTLDDRFDYEDAVFSGAYDLWTDCGDEGTLFVNLAVSPKENAGLLLLLQVALPTGTGQEVLEQILATFTLNEADNAAANLTVEEPVEEENPIATGTAVVRANSLNVRTGPGTNYSRIAGVSRDDQLAITGQVNNCAWLQIITPDGTVGWVSGGAQYVSITADCADIPVVQAPPPPSSSSSGSSGASAGSSSGVPAGKGCYTFQNQLGAELNITFTKADKSWNKTFKVAKSGEHEECFDPGKYTYTLDAPPPWGSSNGELTVNAGDNFYFPITPGE